MKTFILVLIIAIIIYYIFFKPKKAQKMTFVERRKIDTRMDDESDTMIH